MKTSPKKSVSSIRYPTLGEKARVFSPDIPAGDIKGELRRQRKRLRQIESENNSAMDALYILQTISSELYPV